MKDINKLILTNFQQWKKGEIEFKHGLNILIGDTECGKSTLFRAINSILTGKMPEDYIRKGTKGCEVEIYFSDNSIFKRSRNKKDNIANANGTIFERVGKDIPFEYFKQLGRTSIEFGTKELSLCSYSQFEPHFFITLSDYDKSKLIGTSCGIDIVDKLMDLINKDIRNNNTNIKFLEQQISEQKAEKETKVPEFEAVDKKMLKMMEFQNDIQSKFKELETLLNLQLKNNEINNNITTVNKQKNELDSKISDFNSENVILLEKLLNYKNNLEIFNRLEIKLCQEQKSLIIADINKDKIELLSQIYSLKEKLVACNKDIQQTSYHKKQSDDALFTLANEKNNLLKDYDKCPLCGGIING